MPHALYMDVHVSQLVTDGLRRRGIDVLTAQEDLQARTDDELLLRRATDLGRVFYTQDEDFLRIGAEWQSASVDFVGIVYCHQQRLGVGAQVDQLELVAICSDIEDVRNRVRHLPLH